jgi:hypothetical protein
MKFEGISRYTGFFIVIAVLIASSIMCAQSLRCRMTKVLATIGSKHFDA